jgi:LuxR family maltose regulon positive regulatory protein
LSVEACLKELAESVHNGSVHHRRRRTIEFLAVVRLLMAQDRPDEALAMLDLLLVIAERWGLDGRVVIIQTLRALAFHVQGRATEAINALTHALSLAEAEGYVRVFVDEGAPMAQLLRQAASRSVACTYVNRLLAVFEPLAYERDQQTPIPPRFQSLIEPISEREFDVLRLLGTGMSNPEIADELFIAVSTVRSHCKSIYGKLNVHKRWDAVTRARELGLM